MYTKAVPPRSLVLLRVSIMVVSFFFDVLLSHPGCTNVSVFNPKVVRPRLLVLLRRSIMVVRFFDIFLSHSGCTNVSVCNPSSALKSQYHTEAHPNRLCAPGPLPHACGLSCCCCQKKKKKKKKTYSPQSRSSEPLDPLIVGTQSVSVCPLTHGESLRIRCSVL
jgi:hypothetical protein